MTIFPTKVPLCSPKFSFDHLPPSKNGRKVGALPLQSALQVASKLFAQFRCKLFSPTNHGCIAFRPIHTISSRSFFSDMHLTDKSNPDYKGQPFYLGVHISTEVLSVIQASRLNCTLHFLCVLKVSEVPRRSLNLHFLNSPESQTKDKFILIDHHLQLIPNIIDVNIF